MGGRSMSGGQASTAIAARDDTAARVTKILVEQLGVAEAAVRPGTLLVPEHYARGRKVPGGSGSARSCPGREDGRPDLGADSLDVVELAMALEEEFCIEVADDEAEKLNRATVGELVDFVHARLAADDAAAGAQPSKEAGHA